MSRLHSLIEIPLLSGRFPLAVSIMALAIPAAIDAGTRITPIHKERLSLSPSARQKLVLEDLSSILKGPAFATGIATKPYLSSEWGLCRRDVVGLSYSASGSGNAARYKPEGVGSVVVQYHYLGPPQSRSHADWQKECSGLSGVDEYWASSDEGDHYVASALPALEQAIKNLRAGADVTLNCEDEQGDCAADFLAAARSVSKVWRCADSSLNCFQYEMAGSDVTIVVDYPDNRPHTTIKVVPVPITLT